jgi:hypothetical protein
MACMQGMNGICTDPCNYKGISIYSISRGTLDLCRDVNVVKERTISRRTYRQHTETNSEFPIASQNITWGTRSDGPLCYPLVWIGLFPACSFSCWLITDHPEHVIKNNRHTPTRMVVSSKLSFYISLCIQHLYCPHI